MNSTLLDIFEVFFFLVFIFIFSFKNINTIHNRIRPSPPCSNQIVLQFYTFENIKFILNNDATEKQFWHSYRLISAFVRLCAVIQQNLFFHICLIVYFMATILLFLISFHLYRSGTFIALLGAKFWCCAVLITVISMFFPFLSADVVWVGVRLKRLGSFCCHSTSGPSLWPCGYDAQQTTSTIQLQLRNLVICVNPFLSLYLSLLTIHIVTI